MRVASRWLLPTAGAAFAVLLSAQAAHAANLTVTATTPAGSTTETALTWDITSADSSPTSCRLDDGAGSEVAPLADCAGTVSYDVHTQPAGTFTLVVYNDTEANVTAGATPETVSSPVTVLPPAPTVTAPTSPDSDRTPTWSIALPAGATGACTVTDASDNVVVPTTACNGTQYTPSLGASALNGDYTLTVVATVDATPTPLDSAPTTSTYTLDVPPPGAPSVTAPQSPNNDKTPAFTISGVATGDDVTCSVTGPAGVDVQVSSCTTSQAKLQINGTTGLDGDYVVTVYATDVNGQDSPTDSATYTLDVTPPTAPVVTPPTSPGTGTSPVFTVSAPVAGATYACSVSGPGAAVTVTGCGTTSVSFSLAGHPDGIYVLTVTATDAYGNSSSDTAQYELDRAAPTTPTIGGPHGPSSDRSPDFTITEPDSDATITCSVTGGAATATCDLSSASLDITGADGTYTLSVTATDPLGNAVTVTYLFTLDTTVPVPSVTGVPTLTRSATVTLGISDSEAGTTLDCLLVGPEGTIYSGACPLDGVFDTSSQIDGLFTLTVTATDALGNTSTKTVSWTRDSAAPPPPDVTGTPTLTRFKTVTLDISDTEADVALTCVLVGPSGGTIFSGTCPGDGKFDTTGHGDGQYTLTVTATDAAGNSSTTTVSWMRDATAPAQPSVSGNPGLTRFRSVALGISDTETDVTLTCLLVGPDGTVFSDVCPADGVFTTPGSDGLYTLTVTATDAAGNTSTRTVSWTLDTTPPPGPTVTGNATLTRFKTVTLGISDTENGVTLTCLLVGPDGTVSSGACPANGQFNTTGHPDGLYTLTVTATDPAGNSTDTVVSWTRDTIAPQPPDVTGVPTLTRFKTVTLGISDTEDGVTLTCVLVGPNGTVFSGTCPVGGGFDTTGRPDGVYTLTVTATDPAGNTSTTTVSWTRDSTAPPPPSVTGPSDPTNRVQPVVTITDAENGVALTCVLVGPDGTDFSGTCPADGVFNTTGHGDGLYTLTVTATDAAGNTSTTTITWTRDTVDPPPPDVSTPANLTNSRSVTLSIDDTENGVRLTCVLVGPDGVDFSGTCPNSGRFDTSGHGDGLYTLTVTATDAAGNTASTTVSWTRDVTPPPAPEVSGPADPTNDVRPVVTITDTESDVVLTCTLVGPDGTDFSGVCPADGVFDTSLDRDGRYTLTVTATDPAGNPTSTTITWIRDTVAPTPPGVSAPTSPSQGRHPSFTVTPPESSVTWDCTVSGPSVVTVTSCGPTTTIDLTGALDGVYTVHVRAIDAAGNLGAEGTATYTLDTTAPPAPSVSAPPALTRFRTVTLTITDDENGVVLTCRLVGPNGGIVYNSACPANGTFDTTGHAEGLYTLTVTATDFAGNQSTTTVTWMQDTVAPNAPTVTAPTSPAQGRNPAFTVTADESPVTWTCTVTGPSTVTVQNCGPNARLDLTGAADGIYTLRVTATDPAGNTSAAGSATYELDTTAPPRPTVTAPPSPASNRSPSFTVTDPEAGVTWACTVTGPSQVVATTCGPTTVVDLRSAADGTYQLSVYAIDFAGNISLAGTASYVLDTTPPPAPTASAPSLVNTFTTTVTIRDAEAGVTLTCSVTSPMGRSVYAGLCPANGIFDMTGFAEGVYTLVVTATDSAGNASTTTITWTRDTVAPPVPGVAAPASPSQNRGPTFTVGDDEAGVSYRCTVAGPSAVSVSACGPSPRLDLTGALDGTYTLTVVAVDAAGNVSGGSSATFTLDTTAPNTPGVSAPGAPSQTRRVTFNVSNIEPGGTLACTLSTPSGATVQLHGCSTSMTLDLSGQPDGRYVLTVSVTDAAGNVSPVGAATYTLDTTAPSPPSVSSPGATGHDRTPAFGFATEEGASLTCTVARYFQDIYSGPCPPDGVFDLVGLVDGEFEITVTSTDAAGNVSDSTVVVYLLDTQAPNSIVLTAPASPSPIERPVWLWTADDGTTATCTVTDADGNVVQGPTLCTSPFVGQFRRLPDGVYTLTVVITDAAGNQTEPVLSVFTLDRRAPVPPTVVPPRTPNDNYHPIWDISAPRGAELTCTLMRGSTIVFGPDVCPWDGRFDLSGMPDGTYTLYVTATDSAGNISAQSKTIYVLDTRVPHAPRLDYSSSSQNAPSTDTSPYWGFTLPDDTTGRCVLMRHGDVLASKQCTGAVTFDLTGRPSGTYTVRIYAVDSAGNTSDPLVVTYVLGESSSGGSTGGPRPTGGGDGPSGNPVGPTAPAGSGGGHHRDHEPTPSVVQRTIQQIERLSHFVRDGARKVGHGAAHVVERVLPPYIHDRFTESVSGAVQGVVDAVAHAGAGTGFPLMLLLVVLAFLLMQNRIDRRDPKLALASVAADDTVEFLPPPSRGGGMFA